VKEGTDPFLSIPTITVLFRTITGAHGLSRLDTVFGVRHSVSVRGTVSGNGNGRGTRMEGNRYDRLDRSENLHERLSQFACLLASWQRNNGDLMYFTALE